MRRIQVCLFSFCALALSGCQSGGFNSFVYRPTVSQGNLVTQEMVKALNVGMSRDQVQFLLGEALVKSQFHLNRWDYVYYYNPRFGIVEQRTVSVFFDANGRVAKIDYGQLPTEQEADQRILDSRTRN